jgi:hypothetical protein
MCGVCYETLRDYVSGFGTRWNREASELKPTVEELDREFRREEVRLIGCCVLEANP